MKSSMQAAVAAFVLIGFFSWSAEATTVSCRSKKFQKGCNAVRKCLWNPEAEKGKKCELIPIPCRGKLKIKCQKTDGCAFKNKKCVVTAAPPSPKSCADYKMQKFCTQQKHCEWTKATKKCIEASLSTSSPTASLTESPTNPPPTKVPSTPNGPDECSLTKKKSECDKKSPCIWKGTPHDGRCAKNQGGSQGNGGHGTGSNKKPFKKPPHAQPVASDLGLSNDCANNDKTFSVCGYGTSWSKKTKRCEIAGLGPRRFSMERDDAKTHRGHFESNGKKFQIRHRRKSDLPNINVEVEEITDSCVDWELSEETDEELEFIAPILDAETAAADLEVDQVIECRSKSEEVDENCTVDETWQDCAWVLEEDVEEYENVTCGVLDESGTLLGSYDTSSFDDCLTKLGDTASNIVHNGYVLTRYMKWDGVKFVSLSGGYSAETLESYSEHLTTFTISLTIFGRTFTFTITITPFPTNAPTPVPTSTPTSGIPTPVPSAYPTTYEPTFNLRWDRGVGQTYQGDTGCDFTISNKDVYEEWKDTCITLFALDFTTEAETEGITEVVMSKLRWTGANMNFRNMPDLVKIDLQVFESSRQDMYFYNLPLLSEENINIPFKNPGPDSHFDFNLNHDWDLLVHRPNRGVLNHDHIGGALDIRLCIFKDLSFMENLFWLDAIYIIDNPELESLDGLENIARMTGIVIIMNNPKLTDFSALAKVPKVYSRSSHSFNNFGGMWIVSGNGVNPSSIDDLRDMYPKITTPEVLHNYPGYPEMLLYQHNDDFNAPP